MNVYDALDLLVRAAEVSAFIVTLAVIVAVAWACYRAFAAALRTVAWAADRALWAHTARAAADDDLPELDALTELAALDNHLDAAWDQIRDLYADEEATP